MAIGPIHLEWISSLASRGYLRGALLELGPQDIQISRDYLATVAKRHDRLLNFDLSPVCQPDFYKLFGIAKYRSLDENDRRADFKADLNKIVRLFGGMM